MTKTITWGNIHIRDYLRITYGSNWLLALDWTYKDVITCSIDDYEKNNIKYLWKELNYHERKEINQNAKYYDYNEPLYEINSDCKCTMPNFSKLKPKVIKILLKSYNCKNITNNEANLKQLKCILKDETCLCLFNKNCQCYISGIECFSKCACKMKCKNDKFYNQQK
jgi:hypothetical protein